MLRALTYFKSIFNEIIMIILNVGTWYDFCGLVCQKWKIYRYFEMSFSCFRPFGVWGVIVMVLELRLWFCRLLKIGIDFDLSQSIRGLMNSLFYTFVSASTCYSFLLIYLFYANLLPCDLLACFLGIGISTLVHFAS